MTATVSHPNSMCRSSRCNAMGDSVAGRYFTCQRIASLEGIDEPA
jgi:hypothetical protein